MDFQSLHLGLIAPIIIIQLILLIIAIVDIIRIPRTNGPKWVWVIVVLLINILGPIIYFVVGRGKNR